MRERIAKWLLDRIVRFAAKRDIEITYEEEKDNA